MVRSSSLAGIAALGLMLACNALSGIEALEVGDPADADAQRTTPAKDATIADAEPPRRRGESTDDAGGHRPDPAGVDGGSIPAPSDAGFDALVNVPPTFLDEFDRADGPALGNGWSEKTDRFNLQAGAVLLINNGRYVDQIVRRPAAENAADVQLSLDFVYGPNADTDPTMLARMQPESDQPGVLKGYAFYAYRDFAGLDREDGSETFDIAGQAISPELAIGQTYRFVFRVHGTDPVRLEASITTTDGTPLVTMSSTDGSAKKITAAGQIGFAGGRAVGSRWNNFQRIDL